jgi:IPT/TIG domain
MPQPKEIPAEAFRALSSLKRRLGGDKSQYRFGVGLKRTGGQVLDEVTLIVYVPRKRPPAELDPSELVPPEHEQYRTDVVELKYIPLADSKPYDPLRGGIEISPRVLHFIVGRGTLGCVVRRRSDGQKLLLTNEHVASHADANGVNLHDALNQHIFQPSDGAGMTDASIIGHCIAADAALDAALILPNSSRGLKNSVEDIGNIRGTNTIELWEQVRKRGRTTGLTSGLVLVVIAGPSGVPEEVEFVGFPFDSRIADHGDSGSVVVNNRQEIVGLLKAATDETGTNAIATLIAPIQNAFQIEIAVTPIISSIPPGSAVIPALGPVVIDGVGFDPPAQVFFGGVPTSIIQQTSTRLEVSPPASFVPTTVDVRVTNKWGDSSEPDPLAVFKYLPIG